MSSRREVLLGGVGALTAGLLPFGGDDADPVSVDGDDVTPHNVTGYASDTGPVVLGMKHVTGYNELEISTAGDQTTLRVDVQTTGQVSLRAEGAVSRAELVALRREIDAALRSGE